jgi:hypothetical protein
MTYFSADIATAHASKYLQQLCRHFAHKVTVDYSPKEGRVEFPPGRCIMLADDESLKFHCLAREEQAVPVVQSILVKHLVKFAWREELDIEWDGAMPDEVRTQLDSRTFMAEATSPTETTQ